MTTKSNFCIKDISHYFSSVSFRCITIYCVFAVILLITLLQAVRADVLINQVLYDPLQTESGGEFIQLVNTGSRPIDLSVWVIATESSSQDIILKRGTIIQPNQFFLVTDLGWNFSKDNSSWPNSDYEDTMTIGNTNSGIALLNNGSVIDAVGWGSIADPKLFKGSPARAVRSGRSLFRTNFTGNNLLDFIESYPSFIQPIVQSNQLDITITIPDDNLSVSIEDDDLSLQNIQILPKIGATRDIKVYVNATGNQPAGSFGSLDLNFSRLNSTDSYVALIPIPYAMRPGNYPLSIQSSGSSYTEILTVLPILGMRFNVTRFDVTTKEKSLSHNSSIINIGNTALSVTLRRTPLYASDARAINPQRFIITTPEDSYDLLPDDSISLIIPVASALPIVWGIDLPSSISPGTYTTSITATMREHDGN